MLNKRRKGNFWERVAGQFLLEQGLSIIEYNYYCCKGEIDIIAVDNNYLVFVEVKYRKDVEKGAPIQAVNIRKQARIREVAKYYLMTRKIHPIPYCRFDVIGITFLERININWIQDAFY